MTLTRREKYMIVVGLIVVTLAAYLFYFLIPYLRDTTQARQREIAAQTRLNVLNAEAASIDTVNNEIAALQESLKEREASVATGMDHARVLLYLEKLTQGRAVDVAIQTAPDQGVQNRFLTQTIMADFRTTWATFTEIMKELKQNELYHQVAFMKAEYKNLNGQQAVAPAPDGEEPAAPAADRNVITVHLELTFYAFEPAGGQQPEPAAPSSETQRTSSLFPTK